MKQSYRQNENIVFRPEGDEAMLFNPESAEVMVLNVTGCYAWSLCDGKHSVDDITEAFVKEFDVVHENVKKDVANFIETLSRRKFLA